jgi:hypothetical protein
MKVLAHAQQVLVAIALSAVNRIGSDEGGPSNKSMNPSKSISSAVFHAANGPYCEAFRASALFVGKRRLVGKYCGILEKKYARNKMRISALICLYGNK